MNSQLTQRNVAVCIILTIVTCGIYGLYWVVKLNDETMEAAGEQGTSGIMVLVLTIVTCSIYGWFWIYKMGQRMDTIAVNRGLPASNRSILFIILQIFGLGIVNYAIIQSELNKLA